MLAPAKMPAMVPQAAPAAQAPDQVYRSALIEQLAGGGMQPSQQPPVTDALGAAGHVGRAMLDVKRQQKMQNFLLNNVGGGQGGWQTSVTPAV